MRFAAFAAAIAIVALPLPAQGDSLFIAGQQSPLPAPLIIEKGEILAPLIAGLSGLGCKVERDADAVTITSARGKVATLRVGESKAKADGQEQDLAAPPRQVAGTVFLPVRFLARALGLSVRWDEQSRRLAIHGTVTEVTHASLADRQRVTISATTPITYTMGRLTEPERIYVDLTNIDLLGPQRETPVNEDKLLAMRVSQHSVDPDLVRVVLDVEEGAEVTALSADRGCTLHLDMLPPGAVTPGGLASILSVAVGPYRSGMAEVVVNTSAPVEASSETVETPAGKPQVVVEIRNLVPGADLPESAGLHPLIEDIALAEGALSPDGRGSARLSVTLAQPSAHILLLEPAGMRLLVGTPAISDLRIVVDPGHGGRQTGAIGPSGLLEKTANLDVALRLRSLLEKEGAQVIMTRDSDVSLLTITKRLELAAELQARAAVANDSGADLFISIHSNSSPSTNSRSGTETYYHTAWSEPLARSLHKALLKGLKRRDGGIRTAGFIVIKETQCPGVLLELAFLNNEEEEALLGSPKFKQTAAESIVAGIKDYLESGGFLQSQVIKAASARSAPTLPSRHRPSERSDHAKNRRSRK